MTSHSPSLVLLHPINFQSTPRDCISKGGAAQIIVLVSAGCRKPACSPFEARAGATEILYTIPRRPARVSAHFSTILNVQEGDFCWRKPRNEIPSNTASLAGTRSFPIPCSAWAAKRQLCSCPPIRRSRGLRKVFIGNQVLFGILIRCAC